MADTDYKLGALQIRIDSEKDYTGKQVAQGKENLFFCIDWFSNKAVPDGDKKALAYELEKKLADNLSNAGFEVRTKHHDEVGMEEEVVCLTASGDKANLAKVVLAGTVYMMQLEKFPERQAGRIVVEKQ